MKHWIKIIFTLGIFSTLLLATLATAGVSSSQESAMSKAAIISIQTIAQAQNTNAAVSVAADQAAAIGASGGDLQGCVSGNNAQCEVIFKAVMSHIKKILTPDYRMTHSLHLFNANKVNYSLQTAQRISNALLTAQK